MTSVKCPNCGLVNFSNVPACKRCKSPLFSGATTSQQFHAFQTPPPPPVFRDGATFPEHSSHLPQSPPCLKCGTQRDISVRTFVKVYNSPVAILGIFFGLLPYFLLKLLLRTKHNLTGPFCENCWATVKHLNTYHTINTLLFFPLFFIGVVFAFYIDSEWMCLPAIFVPLIILTAGSSFLETLGPKYKRLNSKEVVIDAPNVGEILYTR